MFTFRSVCRFISDTIKYSAQQRPNVRLFVSTVNDLEPNIIYPNDNKKLGKYLDHLSEHTTDGKFNEIRRKYAVRSSILHQLMELENEMKDEYNTDLLDLAVEERRVSKLGAFRVLFRRINSQKFDVFYRIS